MKRSTIEQLPAIAREQIERAIREANFSDYEALAQRLQGFGKGISKSSLHRYAQKLQQLDARAKFEAEVMNSLGNDAAFLVRWARRNYKKAAQLVRRLQKQEQEEAARIVRSLHAQQGKTG